MNKPLCACLLALSCLAPARAQEAPLQEARRTWLKGNYEQARELYEKLLADPKHKVPAAVGLSKALQSKGEYAKALDVLDAALKDKADAPDLLARRAELLHLRGRWDDAEKAADAALAGSKDHFLARWVRACVYSDKGDLKKADAEYRWFVRTYSQRSNDNDDIKDPDGLLLVGLAGTENARWNRLADQFDFILNEVYADALKSDKDFWPAEVQAGLLLLDKYNRADAADAFDKALKLNPNAAEAYVGKGQAALQRLDLKDAEGFAEQALKINPHLPMALRLRADVHLAAGHVAETVRELDRARQVNPREEATLGRLAACLYLQRKQAEFDALAKEVEQHDPKAGVFYYELAERLEERRRFDDAEKYYKKAAELRPQLTGPQNALGLLYMRLGREKEARDALEEAFKNDPFNARVNNNRKVLKHLDKYETLTTAHFELRFDPKHDAVLARFLAEYLEELYAALAEQFRFRPKGPILFEVFTNHEMFSGRVVSLPDLHTIGACTGKMVAMAAPRGWRLAADVGKSDRRLPAFNWARVARHELVHIFNLEQTNYLVPHWFTEGLAVINEKVERPPVWNQLLRERVPAGKLYNLDTIDMGFIRPALMPDDWYMAYCQSQLYVEHIKLKYGADKVGDLLAAFRDGLDAASAIQKVCKVDKAAFEKGYREFLDEEVKKVRGRAPEKPLDFKELKAAYDKDPADLDAAARLAEVYRRRGEKVEARRLADEVLAKRKNHPVAAYVKATLLQAAGDVKEAQALLEGAVDKNNPEPRVVQELAKLYFEAKEPAKAAEMYELGRKAEPYERKWLEGLARAHAEAGARDQQVAALEKLVPLDADDLDNRRRLAKLLLDAGKPADAETYARQALEIDVLDADAQEALLKALAAQKKDAEAERVRKLLGKS